MGLRAEINLKLKKDKPIIGIIGEVGPFAGQVFAKNVFSGIKMLLDQHQLEYLPVSCPGIFRDMTEFIQKSKESAPARQQ